MDRKLMDRISALSPAERLSVLTRLARSQPLLMDAALRVTENRRSFHQDIVVLDYRLRGMDSEVEGDGPAAERPSPVTV